MENIMSVIEWFKANGAQLVAIYTGLVTVASIIVKLTPSLKDDTVLQNIIAFIGKYLALNKTVRDEDRPK